MDDRPSLHPSGQPHGEKAMFAVDCCGKLGITFNGGSLALDSADVLRLLDFLGSIAYRGLVQRAEINAASGRGGPA